MVKRYPFVDSAGLYQLSADDICTAEFVVDASDYDALDRDCDGYIEDRDTAYARIRELEAALGLRIEERRENRGRARLLYRVLFDAMHMLNFE